MKETQVRVLRKTRKCTQLGPEHYATVKYVYIVRKLEIQTINCSFRVYEPTEDVKVIYVLSNDEPSSSRTYLQTSVPPTVKPSHQLASLPPPKPAYDSYNTVPQPYEPAYKPSVYTTVKPSCSRLLARSCADPVKKVLNNVLKSVSVF